MKNCNCVHDSDDLELECDRRELIWITREDFGGMLNRPLFFVPLRNNILNAQRNTDRLPEP